MAKRTAKKKEVEDIKKAIKKPVKEEVYTDDDFISSGITLLDLALSERLGGYKKGSVVHISAKDHVGKTLVMLSMMAKNKKVKGLKEFKFILDEPETAMNFNLDKMFGPGMKDRVTFLPKDRTEPRTVQDWHEDITNDDNYPFLYVLDSFDALTSEDDLKQKDAPGKGGYHTEKAIVASATFPKIIGKMKDTDSIFFWVSQTRANLGMGFEDETESGGKAKNFYRSHYIKLKKVKTLKKRVRGKERNIGKLVKFIVQKNKITGKIREVDIPIYDDYGADDLESMINWMCDNKFWSGGSWINTDGLFSKEGDSTDKWRKKELIAHIEDKDLEPVLQERVKECWYILEDEISTKRKPRYE